MKPDDTSKAEEGTNEDSQSERQDVEGPSEDVSTESNKTFDVASVVLKNMPNFSSYYSDMFKNMPTPRLGIDPSLFKNMFDNMQIPKMEFYYSDLFKNMPVLNVNPEIIYSDLLKNMPDVSLASLEVFNKIHLDAMDKMASNLFTFAIPNFPETLSKILKETQAIWSKMEGHEFHSFLPVYRISVDDLIEEDELYPAIISHEKQILATANISLANLDSADNLKPLFKEAIVSLQEGRYLASQSLLANIYGLIRDTRFVEKNFIPRGNPHILKTTEELRNFVVLISDTYTEEDVKLALMTIRVFANSYQFPEQHDPARFTSRNALAHISSTYFSKYNCLCFLLYVSEVFDLIYHLESVPNSLVKPRTEWPA